MSGRLPDGDDPLPQSTLDTLAWIDGKDHRIEELEAALKELRDEWDPIYRWIQKRDDDNTALTQMADDFDRLLNG